MRRDSVRLGILVVVVVNRVAPITRGLARHEAQQRISLDVRGHSLARQLQERRRVVDVLNQLWHARARGDSSRPARHKRHFQRLLVHPALVVPAVLAQVEALVGAVDDERIFG